VGALAAAVAAAKVLGLEEGPTADALGLAGSVSGGLMEYAETRTMATYLVTGNAARVGVDSAALAGAGFTGPPSVLEGRMGMASAMADEVCWDAVTEGLGLTFRIRETYFKPYPSCRHSHAAIDAARQLAAPDGIDPALIARVEVRSYGLAVDECDHPEFSTLAGADSSFQFTVASTLRYGNFGLRWRSLEHEQLYGHAEPGEPIDLVNIRAQVWGRVPKPALAELDAATGTPEVGRRTVWIDGSAGAAVDVYDRGLLSPGQRLEGPAVLEQMDCTTLLLPGDMAEIDRFGNVLITVGAA
jgi:MmgE/PrpD N-terminal domain/MmgE/PrpD C-terminal domain/Hydantoinase/oxoprolinase C-terminal domain